MRLLVVEDDPRLSEILVRGLREAGYAVDAVRDGQSALYQIAINNYDVVILDVMLPAPDGFGDCRTRVGRALRSVLQRDRGLCEPAAAEDRPHRTPPHRYAAQRRLHAADLIMPIRLRLTLWYLVILTVVLTLVAAGIYTFVAT